MYIQNQPSLSLCSIVKILNLYTILLYTHLYHFSPVYLPSCNIGYFSSFGAHSCVETNTTAAPLIKCLNYHPPLGLEFDM